jgi:intraflagellar transport protein 88
MISACHRRSGNYQKAFNSYKSIHNRFPENVECLKFLVRVCSDLGLKETAEYTEKLKKLEKNKEIKEQRGTSGLYSRSASRASTRRSAASSREGSASSSSSGYLTSASPRSTDSKKNLNKVENDMNRNIIDMSVYEDLSVNNDRPTTSWKRNTNKDDDDFANDEIDDILPE